MDAIESRALFARILLDRVREDRYPSPTHTQLLEEILPPRWISDFLEALFEKVADDPQPSIPMLHRIRRLVDAAR